MSRFLTDEKVIKALSGKFGTDMERFHFVAEEQDAETLKAVGEFLEAAFMLQADPAIVVRGKTYVEIITRYVEALKRGEMPGVDSH